MGLEVASLKGATLLKGFAKGSASTVGTNLLAAPKMVKHHVFNAFRGNSPKSQKYRDFFKGHNINVNDFTVAMSENFHKSWMHGAGRNWTTRWKRWIDANPDATSKQVYQQAGGMMDEYGINHLKLIPYR
jgi:hypothetical protein